MRVAWLAGVVAACGGGGGTSGDGPPGGGDGGTDASAPAAGLIVTGNQITHADGTRFHGRGANLHDTRSCNACSYAPREPDGVDRWADELIDNWHATFIRFLLEAKAAPFNEFEIQWMNLNDDPQYLADIVQNVTHMTGKGAYVMVTLFADPTIKDNNGEFDSEWPSSLGDSNPRYVALAEAFADDPRVLFGLTNEPHTTPDHDAELAAVYADAIAAIRAVEDARGVAHHVVVVQAHEGYARDLSYFVANPLAGDQIAYEIHPYNAQVDFDDLIVQPAQTLPILIGEYGPAIAMTEADVMVMWQVAQQHEVPYIAWNFHQRCPPNTLEDTAPDGCGLAASTGYDWPRTPWGDLLFDHMQTPW
jgi:endoglucanase